jgi:dolichol-phosphate mannosyltransferase
LLASFAVFAAALSYKLLGLKDFVETPLPLLSVLFALVGILSILMGLLAELVVRTYYESQNKRPYLIAERINPALSPGLGNGKGQPESDSTGVPREGIS